MRWSDVDELTIRTINDKCLPVRTTMTRKNGSEITAGGVDLVECVTTLVFTAGLGRHKPAKLAVLIADTFGDRSFQRPYNMIINQLARANTKNGRHPTARI